MVLAIVVFVIVGSMYAIAMNDQPQKVKNAGGIYGGTLNIALNAPVSTLDPRTATDDMTWCVMNRIFDTLVVQDQSTGGLTPWMIKDLGTWNGASDTLTVTLKDNIKFQDETVVSASDVKATYTSSALKSNPLFTSVLSHVTSVDISGNNIIFTFDKPYAPFYYDALAKIPILPASFNPSNPVGSGAFKYVSMTSTSVTLARFDDYFYSSVSGGPYIDGIQYTVYSGSNITANAIADCKAGKIDYIAWAIQPYEISGASVMTSQDYGFYYMGFNVKNVPLNDIKFRHAMGMCTDKKTIVVQSISNFGTIGNAVVSPGNSMWYNSSVQNDYAHIWDVNGDGKITEPDVTACLAPVGENLTKAGYIDVNGDGRRELPGSVYPTNVMRFNFTALVPSSKLNPQEDAITSSVVTNMRNIGINVIDNPYDQYTDRDKNVSAGNFGIYFSQYQPSSPDPSYIYDLFHTGGSANTFGYSNSTIDAKIDKANQEMDITTRQGLVKDVEGLLALDNPAIIVYYPLKVEAIGTTYTGWASMVGGINNIWSYLNVHKTMIGSLSIQIDSSTSLASGVSSPFTVTVKSGVTTIRNATIEVNATDGSFTPSSGTTDSSGQWVSAYMPPVVTQDKTITITVNALATQYISAQQTMYLTVSPTLNAFDVSIKSSTSSIVSGSPGTITVTVKEKGGNSSVIKGRRQGSCHQGTAVRRAESRHGRRRGQRRPGSGQR